MGVEQIAATVTLADTMQVRYLLTPGKLGILVTGPRKTYLLQGR